MSTHPSLDHTGITPSTAVFDTGHRVCESCGGAMPSRMSRQRNESGALVCDTCKTKNAPSWKSAHASTLLLVSPDSRAEFFRREAEAVSSILRIERLKDAAAALATGNVHLAHDMGDGGVVNHCPFCGSGAVVGGSDGSVECGFCHTVFSVQVQPSNPSMPQTVNGQPFVPPGMPAGEPTEMSEPKDPVAEQQDQQEGEDPSGAQQPQQPGHPSGGDPNPSSQDLIKDRQVNSPHEKAKVEDAAKGLPGAKPSDANANPFAKDGDPDKAQPGAKGDPATGTPPVDKGADTPLDPTAPVLYVPEDAPAGQRPTKVVDKGTGAPDTDKDSGDPKKKNLPPWMKKKTSALSGWQPFTFYHGTLTGWRSEANGIKYEIIPTNGRSGSWDVLENEEWVGETFPSPEEAAAWVDGDGPTTAVLGSFRTPDGVLDGEAYMRRLALQFADDRNAVLAEIRDEAGYNLLGHVTERA